MARVTERADRERVAGALADGLVEEFGVALARIWLYDPARDAIHLRATAGLIRDPSIGGAPIPLGELSPPVAAALRARRALVLNDLRPDSGLRDQAWLTENGVRAYTGFPLVVGERLCGYAMMAFQDTPVPSTILEAVALLARQAALALDQARLLDASHALQGIAADLAATRDPGALLDGIVEQTMAVLGADACGVYLLDEASGRLRPAAARGLSAEFLDVATRRGGSDPAVAFRQVQRTGRPHFTRTDPAAGEAHDRAAMAVMVAEGIVGTLRLPLFAPGGQVAGMLSLYHRRERPYGDEEVRLAQAFADQLAVTLHNARLAEQERRTSQERASLLEVSRHLASSLELEPLLDMILDQIRAVAEYDGAAITSHEGDRVRIIRRRAPTALAPDTPQFRGVPPERTAPDWEAISRREPVIIADVRGDDPLAAAYRAGAGGPLETSHLSYVRSWMAVPLALADRVIGRIVLAHGRPGYYTPHHAELVAAIAAQVAAAIEHARLYEEARAAQAAAARQLERLGTLARITERLLAATDLDAVLRVVVEAGHRLCGATMGMVGLIDRDTRQIIPAAFDGEPRAYFEEFIRPVLDEDFFEHTATGQALARRAAVAVEDYAAWGRTHRLQQKTVALGVRAMIAAPLLVEGVPTGVLWVNDVRPRTFAAEDVALVQALAGQAALAIEHARLAARGRDAAALEERARLARELHDSVTQSVFSLGLFARTAQTQHARGSDQLGGTLERVATLARDALAEMRALLFELRPAALEQEGLAGALEQLVAAMRVRSELTITYAAETDVRLPADSETAIFRIVQEALGNAAKHARATAASVTLAAGDGVLRVEVRDDGVGFDPGRPAADGRSGGMGLRSMRERAAATGLTLRVMSAPGAGTRVTVTAPLPRPPRQAGGFLRC